MKRIALTALLSLPACKGPGTLVAPGGHHRLTARDAASGVTVIMTTAAWSGSPQNLGSELTVVHVLVANLGKAPILLAPGDIELVDRRGFRYDLLDPGATFHQAPAEDDPDAAQEEGDAARNAPREYARAYEAEYDLGRAQHFQWFEAVGDVAVNAMPWGVLQPGTQMRGYIYFEPMTQTANGGTLTWHIETPEHRAVVDAVFELAVARP